MKQALQGANSKYQKLYSSIHIHEDKPQPPEPLPLPEPVPG